ncbi:MAG: thiamine-phosphate kinase [Leucobacter sp.]|nr:thiamine-phosphate kinase [Leucobacter sp.]
MTVGEAGEKEVLARVLGQLSHADAAAVGPGDDCAVMRLAGDLVVTSDMMIEGPDFRLAWHTGFELGHKLAATNLSDVAAMGARPVGLTVSLACPRDTKVVLLEEIARGLDAACRTLAPGCGVVGGDLSTAPVLTAAVTALGDLEGRPAVLRSGAKVGDVVAYAGQLGLAGLGLSLLFAEAADDAGIAQAHAVAGLRASHPEALAAQLTPDPPIVAGPRAARAGATAMMDVSDGLSLDAARLAAASDGTLAFDSVALTAAFGVQGGQAVSVAAMLTGGEDHGLLATFDRAAALPEPFTAIGEVRQRGGGGAAVLLDGVPYEPRGWDPYRVLPPGA